VLELDASQDQSAFTCPIDGHYPPLLLSVYDAELVVIVASELAEEVGGVEHGSASRACATRVSTLGHLDTVPAPHEVRA